MSENVPTLSDVAAHAGVSLATASRALNGSSRRVNAELYDRVLMSARTLRYSANSQAQAVARGTSNLVGLIVSDITDPYFAAIASGVMRVADERGLIVTITATGAYEGEVSIAREEAALSAIQGQRSRAVVLAGSRIAGVEPSARSRERVAVIGGGAPALRTVGVDNHGGAAALARELLDLGYRDFVVLAGPEELVTVRDRVGGFQTVVPSAAIVDTEFSRAGGHRAMQGLLASGVRPECVFAVSDVMAIGAMAAMREAGIAPGEEVALAGFDDIPLVADVTPALTSVALPLAEIGAQALELALAGNSAINAPPVMAQVRVRASTPRR